MSYLDRYLSKAGRSGLDKQRVQLLALTCTLIAAKFLEVKTPSLDDLCKAAKGKYTKAQLNEMELETLRVLGWELHAVTPHAALEQLAITIEHTDERSKSVLEHAELFIDMSYFTVRPVPITPSYVPPVTSLDTPAPSPTSTPSHPHNPTLTTRPSSTSLADRTPSGAAQYEILKFPPLVVASSALLVAWSHLGHTVAIEAHMHKLCALCGVDQHELLTCQTILLEYFNATFPEAAEAVERFRERCRAAEATHQTAEATRQAAEATRQACEVTRQKCEVTRQAAEATRQACEVTRQKCEATERACGATRQKAEATRQAAEAGQGPPWVVSSAAATLTFDLRLPTSTLQPPPLPLPQLL